MAVDKQTCLSGELRVRRPVFATHLFVELDRLVHLPREAIDEESMTLAIPHGIGKESDGDLLGDDNALLDVITDELAIFGSAGDLSGRAGFEDKLLTPCGPARRAAGRRLQGTISI
jgi:hypothetical protein